ncbi:MAG TPA: hypothetical protein VFP72_02645 [Kineosporiaceae bacterium]|nr:hypothetical protein [Kineosporiaceae bacterium]
MNDRARTPAGWPAGVRPPGDPEWRRSAVGWLLDQCPADYRGYPVLARHPVALLHLAVHHVGAQLQANRQALAGARSRLRELPPPALAEVVEVLELEQVRLQAATRGLTLVAEAMRRAPNGPRQ